MSSDWLKRLAALSTNMSTYIIYNSAHIVHPTAHSCIKLHFVSHNCKSLPGLSANVVLADDLAWWKSSCLLLVNICALCCFFVQMKVGGHVCVCGSFFAFPIHWLQMPLGCIYWNRQSLHPTFPSMHICSCKSIYGPWIVPSSLPSFLHLPGKS